MDWRSLTREPLLVFVVGGALLLGIEAARGESDDGETSDVPGSEAVIEVEARHVEAARTALERTHARAPNAAELAEQVEAWVAEEILVREARARGLDRDDPVIRARLAQQMIFLLAERELAEEPDEAELRAWYADNRDALALPARVTVRQAFFVGLDAQAEARARAAAAEGNAGADAATVSASGDAPPGGPVLRGRTPARLTELYGSGFADAVASLEAGSWEAVAGLEGWHAVVVLEREAGGAPSYDEARDRVAVRFQRERERAAAAAALATLRERYRVVGWPP